MFPAEFEYFSPTTIDEALELLGRYGDEAKILAGGQSLIPMMKLRIAAPRYLVDVNRIEALTGLDATPEGLVCGALCRHAEIAASSVVQERLPLMADSAALTADVQVRNRGTIGGSLAHADPSGDWPASLLALDARVTTVGPGGERVFPLHEFLVDAYTTPMGPDEMLAKVFVPWPTAPAGGAYVKFEKRAGDFAVASIGVQLELAADGSLRKVAVSLGAVGSIPTRAREAEGLLLGKKPEGDLLARAAELVRGEAQPFADTRGSVDYKRHLAGVLFGRAFAVALDRARGKKVDTLHA